ncbi:MAG: DUF3408 domain-containing protein [Muribaculum sp.]|nr:DUF3408 domain-containing protein [Muribaculum sp.]
MNNPRFCDLNTCAKAAQEVGTGFPDENQIASYKDEFLAPYTVGARKGIFVPRELVNKLAKTVALFDNRDLTIGAYVTNIIISHLVANRDVINELTDRGSKTVVL